MASWLAEIVKQSGIAIRPGVIHKAALLAKTDLTTELVKEFTELQGIVGGLYARVQELGRRHEARRAAGDFAGHLRSLQARVDGGCGSRDR